VAKSTLAVAEMCGVDAGRIGKVDAGTGPESEVGSARVRGESQWRVGGCERECGNTIRQG